MDDFDGDSGGGGESDGGRGALPRREHGGNDEDDGDGVGGEGDEPRSAGRKREREPTMHWAETGFAGYMQAKVRKLEEQHRSNQALQPALSSIFAGVSIHVNGLTDPSHAVRERGREGGAAGGAAAAVLEREGCRGDGGAREADDSGTRAGRRRSGSRGR